MNATKNRTNTAGFTAFDVNHGVISPSISPIRFPDKAVKKRVLIERPAPSPVERTCPYCGAKFEDYTQRWNTIYDRPSCKTMMYRLKRRTAIQALADANSWILEMAQDVYEERGLEHVEKLLNEAGYHFEAKAWLKP